LPPAACRERPMMTHHIAGEPRPDLARDSAAPFFRPIKPHGPSARLQGHDHSFNFATSASMHLLRRAARHQLYHPGYQAEDGPQVLVCSEPVLARANSSTIVNTCAGFGSQSRADTLLLRPVPHTSGSVQLHSHRGCWFASLLHSPLPRRSFLWGRKLNRKRFVRKATDQGLGRNGIAETHPTENWNRAVDSLPSR
jgi:hypothetical protein